MNQKRGFDNTFKFLWVIAIVWLIFAMAAPTQAVPQDDEKVLPTPIPVEEDPGFTAPAIDIPLDAISSEMLLHVSDPALLNELITENAPPPILTMKKSKKGKKFTGSSDDGRGFSVYLGMVSEVSDSFQLSLQFDTDNPEVRELLGLKGSPTRNSGNYSVVNMVVVDTDGSGTIFRLDTISAQVLKDFKSTKRKFGCCAILAVAHSLVRKMGGLVTQNDATEFKTLSGSRKQMWKPRFLKDVWRESGDTDGDYGLTDSQAEKAHKANWNTAWVARQIDDDVELYTGSDISRDGLKARYNTLKSRLRTNDDITMRIRGRSPSGKKGKKGKEWGHRVPVESVSFNESTYCMAITITRTSRQGSGNLEDIPFQPGTATYSITTNASGHTTVSNTEFPGSTILRLVYDSFDEEPRHPGVNPKDQGGRGSALSR